MLKLFAIVTTLVTAWLPLHGRTVFTTSDWNTHLSSVIHADGTQSTMLPSGKVLWTFGDTTWVNGVSTVGAYGYPHSAFVTQQAGTLNFTAVPGSYGYGWQQVPNWPDGTYFWMSTPIVDNGTLYVLGQRINGASNFTVVGSYVATFDVSTLTFQSIVQVPGNTTGWGGVSSANGGWWITGTHSVPCSYATYCHVGDMAFVPFGQLATPSAWQVYNDVIPATANVGATMGLVQTGSGWDIFTKLGDAYGGTVIERLHADSLPGTWTVNGTWATPSPSGTVTYGVATHPEQASPAGQVLVSYNVNGGSDSDYHALFLYLPL